MSQCQCQYCYETSEPTLTVTATGLAECNALFNRLNGGEVAKLEGVKARWGEAIVCSMCHKPSPPGVGTQTVQRL